MLDFISRFFARHDAPPPAQLWSVSVVSVHFDDKAIVTHHPGGAEQAIAWGDIASVTVRTTAGGPFVTDLFWVLAARDGRSGVTVPMGATGEQEFLRAMQSRLHGFDNMSVVEAMGSTDDASFVVWEAPAKN